MLIVLELHIFWLFLSFLITLSFQIFLKICFNILFDIILFACTYVMSEKKKFGCPSKVKVGVSRSHFLLLSHPPLSLISDQQHKNTVNFECEMSCHLFYFFTHLTMWVSSYTFKLNHDFFSVVLKNNKTHFSCQPYMS